MSYGLPNETLSGCRRTKSSTLMDLHFETHLYLHSNNDMYMWNQVNCTQNYYTNVRTSGPYNQWSYPLVSCPHQQGRLRARDRTRPPFRRSHVTTRQGHAVAHPLASPCHSEASSSASTSLHFVQAARRCCAQCACCKCMFQVF
jgi:hypothetical protein